MGSADWGALAHGLKTAKQYAEEDYERQRQQLLDQIMMETTRLQWEDMANRIYEQNVKKPYLKQHEEQKLRGAELENFINAINAARGAYDWQYYPQEKRHQLEQTRQKTEFGEQQLRLGELDLQMKEEEAAVHKEKVNLELEEKRAQINQANAQIETLKRQEEELALQIAKLEAERPYWEDNAKYESERKRLEAEQTQIKRDREELEYKTLKETSEYQIEQSKLLVEQTEAEIAKLKKEIGWIDQEYEVKLAEAKARAVLAEVQLKEAQERYDAMQALGGAKELVRLDFEAAKTDLQAKQQQLAVANAQLEQIAVEIEETKARTKLLTAQTEETKKATQLMGTSSGRSGGSSGGSSGSGSSGSSSGGSITSKAMDSALSQYKNDLKAVGINSLPSYFSYPNNKTEKDKRWATSRSNPNGVIDDVLKRMKNGSLSELAMQPDSFWLAQGYDPKSIKPAMRKRVINYMIGQLKTIKDPRQRRNKFDELRKRYITLNITEKELQQHGFNLSMSH